MQQSLIRADWVLKETSNRGTIRSRHSVQAKAALPGIVLLRRLWEIPVVGGEMGNNIYNMMVQKPAYYDPAWFHCEASPPRNECHSTLVHLAWKSGSSHTGNQEVHLGVGDICVECIIGYLILTEDWSYHQKQA